MRANFYDELPQRFNISTQQSIYFSDHSLMDEMGYLAGGLPSGDARTPSFLLPNGSNILGTLSLPEDPSH